MSGLDAMIASLRKLGTLPRDVAKRAAPGVEAAAKKTAAAGTDPDGTPWKPKKDGGRPLVHAADHVTAKAIGSTVVIELKGVEVLHHFGTNELPKRPIIPDRGGSMPKQIGDAIRAAAEKAFDAAIGGA